MFKTSFQSGKGGSRYSGLRRGLTMSLACCVAFSLSGCLKPPLNMPSSNVIGYDGMRTVPPDCHELSSPSLLTDGGLLRPSMQWGCATYTNLAAQIARPADLVAPLPLGPADGAVLANGVERYKTDKVMPLDSGTTRSSR